MRKPVIDGPPELPVIMDTGKLLLNQPAKKQIKRLVVDENKAPEPIEDFDPEDDDIKKQEKKKKLNQRKKR